MDRDRKTKSLLLAAWLVGVNADAQRPFASPAASATPFRGFAQSAPAAANPSGEPPRDIPLVEKSWSELPVYERQLSTLAGQAYAIRPDKWKHAETANFLLHYRRVTEAQKVAREIEYDLWFVATSLHATKDRYEKKSHVFVFADEAEWKTFLDKTDVPSWATSFARNDELFLNVRADTGEFDSRLLAHETTHAVVARLYPRQPWPLWLNEGFAEYMGSAGVAARKNQTVKRHERTLTEAKTSLSELVKIEKYPEDRMQVAQLYETGEKFVRFMMSELPPERFPKFVDAVLAGKSLQDSLLQIYGDRFKDFAAFTKKFERFSK
ncbi:MAG: Peptidase superfamily [Chthoniobacter sp.]|jgi:hypothetical protein|nr:Peptidase superfamily [Chthoniobacter sp.]